MCSNKSCKVVKVIGHFSHLLPMSLVDCAVEVLLSLCLVAVCSSNWVSPWKLLPQIVQVRTLSDPSSIDSIDDILEDSRGTDSD